MLVPRFAEIDRSDYEFLLTFGSADSRIRLRKDSGQLVDEFGVWASRLPVKRAFRRDRLM